MDVTEFYSGANVLITGGTGFVGLCLIEKLLRCIPKIGKIYLLIREKMEKTLSMRLNDITNSSVFNLLKERYGNSQFNKLHVVSGDISKDNLELSVTDECLLINNVNVVFHLAANLDFNENLKNSININLLGTKRVIELCKKMTNLKVFVHVSSAYVNTNRKYIKEILYPLPRGGVRISELIENLDEVTLAKVMPVILYGLPNAYTFTKALAEHEVSDVNKLFPTVIVRPGMIIGAWKEPTPGWTGSRNGPHGFFMAAAKGIVRRLPVDKHLIYDYIPVDTVVNEIISSGWYVVKTKPSDTLILHCTTSTYRPFKWVEIERHLQEFLNSYPLESAVWYPTLKFVPSISLYRVSSFIYHMIPAYIIDFMARLNGSRPILVKLHKNINKSLETLSPFIFNEWKFNNTNTLMLHESLSDFDQLTFGVDVKDLVWKTYFRNLVLGVRLYLSNESLNNLNRAKKKNSNLWLQNIILQVIVFLVYLFILAIFVDSSIFMGLWTIPAFIFFYYL